MDGHDGRIEQGDARIDGWSGWRGRDRESVAGGREEGEVEGQRDQRHEPHGLSVTVPGERETLADRTTGLETRERTGCDRDVGDEMTRSMRTRTRSIEERERDVQIEERLPERLPRPEGHRPPGSPERPRSCAWNRWNRRTQARRCSSARCDLWLAPPLPYYDARVRRTFSPALPGSSALPELAYK